MLNKFLIYGLRLVSAVMQLGVVFFLSGQTLTGLGVYSFVTAVLAILMQVVQFEGAQLCIGNLVSLSRLHRIYKTTSFLWIAALIVTALLLWDRPLVLVFVLIFVVNLTSEWAVNFLTLGARLQKDDSSYRKYLRAKVLISDILLPFLTIGLFVLFDVAVLVPLIIVFGVLTVFILIRVIGVSGRLKDLAFPKMQFLYGVTVKRLDSMFIRIFVGASLGAAALGALQPLLSVARIINMFTPTWINLNFAVEFKDIAQKQTAARRAIVRVAVSYLAYALFACVVFFLFRYASEFEYSIWLTVLVVTFFGNQNTKALLRSFHILQKRLRLNNILLNVGLALKLIGAMLSQSYGVVGVLLACTIADALIITASVLTHWRFKMQDMEIK